MSFMANPARAIKTATGVLVATAGLLSALKDNPQLAAGVQRTLATIKGALKSKSAKQRFDAQIAAIEACAVAVEEQFPEASEPADWRQAARTLQLRAELVWATGPGGARRKAMKTLSRDTTALLASINARLAQLTPGLADAIDAVPKQTPRRRLGLGRTPR